MSENLFYGWPLKNRGDDLQLTTAVRAMFQIEVKDALQ
jgi:hypothetical protein